MVGVRAKARAFGRGAAMAAAVAALAASGAKAAEPASSAAARAEALVAQLTDDEKLSLIHGQLPLFMKDRPKDIVLSAGFVPGVERLGIPALRETDASLGVANAGRPNDDAVALPSGLMLASTFDPDILYAGGAMIGREARQKGFNVMLAGGVNLVREPRNGRNFEYLGEDPLLAGMLDAASVRGIQSNRIASTVKHYALNAQEDGRHVLNAVIDPAALRESDLLAFELAIEHARPASVMCAYNKVNGVYACENGALFDILKRDWGFPGWVMSDWGAVHSATAALTGLDQESGEQLDKQVYFGQPFKEAMAQGQIPKARLDEMVRRILTGLIETGVIGQDQSAPPPLDTAADAAVAARAAEAGLVLLKNDQGLLPLSPSVHRIAVIGGRADIGVMSGGGSSQVIPLGSKTFKAPPWGPPWGPGMVFHPSSPLAAIKARAPSAEVSFDPGTDPKAGADAARGADVAVVFATQWTSEGADAPMILADGQDAMIAAVLAANPHTIVVLENGGPVFMPWLSATPAVVEAWYPGQKGGEAIAKLLFGDIDAAGRLPVSFPASLDQLPRPKLDGEGITETADLSAGQPFDVNYGEGADVGYRWYEKQKSKPLFPFGWGLSYTRFRYDQLQVSGGAALTVKFRVTNVGAREGTDTAQVYAAGPGQTRRLIGWGRASLKPNESRVVTVTADPRLLADFDVPADKWRLKAGEYRIAVGAYAGDAALTAKTTLASASIQP